MYLSANVKNDYMAGFVSATHPLLFLLLPFRQGFMSCFRGLGQLSFAGDGTSCR